VILKRSGSAADENAAVPKTAPTKKSKDKDLGIIKRDFFIL
jgi:hypothetical protein